MSYSSKLTRERILKCAMEEFLCKDFLGANLREIAKNANVTTGALYNHFKNKEMLFDAIVKPFADEMLEFFTIAHAEVPVDIAFAEDEKRDSMASGSFKVLDYIYNNLSVAKLLFFCSNGTAYENYVDKLIEIEEKYSVEAIEKENIELNEVNRFFIHVIASSGMRNMLEAVHHDLSRDDAFEYMQKIQRFYYAGSKEILGV